MNTQHLGTSQLLSVPYAMFAQENATWGENGDNIYLKEPGNVGIGSYSPTSKLEIAKDFTTTNTIEDLVDILSRPER
jgi:hypothetical protein